ncbi:E3 ubiquitin-protein ligase MARCH [Aspergillus clavatus NRRL 1]|uniref:RING finger domain protein n=1 Tax=Aspergillus clavatus (strain ATCC 1007 / CBS 513.65 / DSM 816 / NCTC 3887 / NRRL 1 / QM 1276 / 107) TaxID=344612 RepID=A1CDR9_ASPCL|nr:RING finger domain protein [Aspergillus clavatus NRRL 1]EAW11996.1 RING finger domain protein [Aspergillus clavatus NRRL 1]
MNVHNEPLWQWPSSIPSNPPMNSEADQASQETHQASNTDPTPSESPRKTYPHRTCRICLETVPPTFHPPSENLPGFLQPKPRVVYESADPELGRLLRPCKCKGSSRYVHEGCLQSWRHADPDYGKRNYWQCPTCGFQYRLERLKWAHWINSTLTQIGLTLSILLLTVFSLGFVADPIINLYVDPVETIFHTEYWESSTVSQALPAETRASWIEHFVKGLASLGVLSFIKAILALTPWHWLNLRTSGVVSSGRTTGRSRVASISWVIILIGVLSFLWAVWKGVRTWSRKMLEKAGERVMDVPLPDDEDEDASSSSAEPHEPSKKDN